MIWGYAIIIAVVGAGIIAGARWAGYEYREIARFPLLAVGFVVVGIPVILGGSGVFVFGKQCYDWLKYGKWVPREFREALVEFDLPWPQVKWIGMQKIIDAVLEVVLAAPLSLGLMLSGLILFSGVLWIGTQIEEALASKKRE
jgi:hypothetical protein